MRGRLLTLFALLAAVFTAALSTTAPARALSCGPCPAVTTSALNLRAAPNVNAEVLLVIPNGAEVEYDNSVPRQDGYLAVSYNGVNGYAHSLYLLLFPATASTSDWLNLRSGPSTTSSVIQVMPPGSLVQVRSKARERVLRSLVRPARARVRTRRLPDLRAFGRLLEGRRRVCPDRRTQSALERTA